MLSKVSTTLGLSSASMAASESEFSISSSSKSPSPGAASPASPCSPPLPTWPRSGAPLNGVAPAGAAGGAALCASTGGPGTGGPAGRAPIRWPAGPLPRPRHRPAAGPALGAFRGGLSPRDTLLAVFARLLGLDDVDAHLAEHGEHVFDLLGIDLLGGQHRVDLVMGHVAAFLGGADELLDRGVGEVEQRQRRVRRLGRLFFRRFFLFFFLLRCLGLARHTSSPGDRPARRTPITPPPPPHSCRLDPPIWSAR